jgi:hypothetical protein
MNGDNLIPLKDVPLRAIPVLVFLAATFVFGTMVAELPTRTPSANLVHLNGHFCVG